MESMIRAKGYEDAVVMIGDESVNVVVAPPEGGLQATDVTVIKDIVVAEAGVTAGQIKIVEAE
nr:SpoIIIAH-like family protein [uncultured Agathobaculum sp.]